MNMNNIDLHINIKIFIYIYIRWHHLFLISLSIIKLVPLCIILSSSRLHSRVWSNLLPQNFNLFLQFDNFLRFNIFLSVILDLFGSISKVEWHLWLLGIIFSWWNINKHESLWVSSYWILHQMSKLIGSIRNMGSLATSA